MADDAALDAAAYGCFALWEGAQQEKTRILADLESHFQVIGVFEIFWTDANYIANFERLYERPLTRRPFKRYNKKIGKPPFTFVIVKDGNPRHRYSMSASGQVELNNQNLVAAKMRFRSLFERPYLVHSSNNEREFYAQAPLVLGLDLFQQTLGSKGVVRQEVHSDLEGAEGWRDWQHFFRAINFSEDYVVLRNHEALSDPTVATGDVDILAASPQRLCAMGNIVQRKKRLLKGFAKIGGTNQKIDFSVLGDRYLPEKWQSDILNQKIYENFYYRPNDIDLYFSILYHILLHKTIYQIDIKNCYMTLRRKTDST